MTRDDALLAFERHATSKIRRTEDLFGSARWGFAARAGFNRLGRARRDGADDGGGRGRDARPDRRRAHARRESAAHPVGTTITVRDLFFNVPAVESSAIRSDESFHL